MANDEVIGPRKTMFVLVIVVGCFAVLWPRILSPLVLGPTREQIQPNQFDREAGCCEVIFETDVAVLELVNEVCSSALGVGKLSSHSAAECRKAVNDTCGVDIAVFLKRNENVGKTTKMLVETMQNSNSSCLRENFGVPIYSLGPHLAANSWNVKDTLKQERAPPMRGMGPHPALRERGRAIPPGPPGPPPPPASRPVTLPPHVRVRSPLSVYYEDEQPPPIPGMRPPLGSPGGPVPAPKSSMGFVMPIYTICIIVFFVYTLTKILFRRQGAPYEPIAPDPQFRRRVFRDDSRSSPEKLGKKEADTIVTAISGLVAEVQQQMEASGAPNQQRQDVQDNARAYTNGTILLNSGPVQIVTSEYKEASEEKTPKPVNEKESTPQPKEAEPIKVVKEPCSEVEESIPNPKESFPEPEVTLEENNTTSEVMVVRESSPKPSAVEECIQPAPKLNVSIANVTKEPTLEPIPKPSEAPTTTAVAKDFILECIPTSELKDFTAQSKESTPESEVLQYPISKTVSTPVELSEFPKDIALISDSNQISLELKESSPELKEFSPISTAPIAEPKQLSTALIEPTTDLKVYSPQPTEPIFESKEISLEQQQEQEIVTETLLTSIEPPPEFNSSTLHIKSSSESEKCFTELNEPSLEPEDPTPKFNDLSLDPLTSPIETKETLIEPDEIITQSKEGSLESKEAVIDLQESLPIPIEPSTESKETFVEFKDLSLNLQDPSPGLKDLLLDSITSTIEPKEISSEPEEPTIQSKELSLETVTDHKKSSRDLNDQSLEPKITVAAPEELKEPISESKESLPDLEESLEPTEFDSSASTLNIKEPIHESFVIIPENKTVIANIDKSVLDHKESTPELIDNSQEPEFTEHSPEIEAPVVECSPEPEHTEHSLEVVAPGIEYKSPLKTDSCSLKEPTPQSKETPPEGIVPAETKTIQVEENQSIPEGTLLDLEEALADVDNFKTDLKAPDQFETETSEELLNILEETDAVNDVKGDLARVNDKFLQGERFVVVRRSTPDIIDENAKLHQHHPTAADDYKIYTEADEEDIENAAVKVMGMEMTAHPVDGSEWPRDERPPPPASPASPPPRAPHAAEEVKSIFLETEIPQQSRVLVAQFQEDRPRPAAHAPLVVSGKMTLSLIQDAPRETPERDPESTLDEFTTASAVTQPAAEKGEIESDEEIDEEIEVEEIELEEEEEEEEPPPVKTVVKK